jgi:hypothetical protein
MTRCDPYDCDLLEASCAARYRAAQKRGSSLRLGACRTCDAGRKRAGESRPHARFGRRPPSRYAVLGKEGRDVTIECQCGRVRTIDARHWESRDRPAMCSACLAKRRVTREWNAYTGARA